MKPGRWLGRGFLLAAAVASAQAGECVTIALHHTMIAPPLELLRARAIASEIFSDIGIETEWHEEGFAHAATDCMRIEVEFQGDSDALGEHAGVLGWALPYRSDGVRVYVVPQRLPRGRTFGSSLGYVLAHEIAHVLEGICRHSNEGLMKARWNSHDFADMADMKLQFSPHDAQLIHMGLSAFFGKAPPSPLYSDLRVSYPREAVTKDLP